MDDDTIVDHAKSSQAEAALEHGGRARTMTCGQAAAIPGAPVGRLVGSAQGDGHADHRCPVHPHGAGRRSGWPWSRWRPPRRGSTASAAPPSRSGCCRCARAVEDYLKPLLVGRDPQRIEDIWQLGYQNAYWRNGPVLNNALSGVDQALWDIKGKVAGLPLLPAPGRQGARRGGRLPSCRRPRSPGGPRRRAPAQRGGLPHIRCQMGGYGGIGRHGIAEGRHGLPAGRATSIPTPTRAACPPLFDHLRSSDRLRDRAAPRRPRAAARPSTPCAWPRRWSPIGCSSWRTRWRRRTRSGSGCSASSSATPIAMGELFTHPLEWRPLIVNGLIDFIRVHISDIGGITPARKLAALCEAFGVRTAFHGPGDVSPGRACRQRAPGCRRAELRHPGVLGLRRGADGGVPGLPGGPGWLPLPERRPRARHRHRRAGSLPRYPLHPKMSQFRDGVVDWTQSRLPDGTLTRP